jgi:simple sugar transport system permease protein
MGVSAAAKLLLRFAAVVLALLTGALFIRLIGFSPAQIYAGMVKGVTGSTISVRETVKIAAPLCVTALGLAVAFRMRFWNIGGEGQMTVGAIAASYIALFHADLPQPLLIVLMSAASIIAAGFYGFIPAWFNARFGTNETLFTLMLNYIAIYVVQYLREGPWKNPKDMGYPKIAMFAANAQLPKVLGVHIGWIIALALAVLVFVYMRYTKQGYELTVVGESSNTARYAGMPVRRIIIRTAIISAALCGLAGMMKAAGADRTLTDGVAGGIGFTAITVSWLSELNPIAIVVVSLLFSALEKGAGYVQSTYKISSSAAAVLQGIILFFVLGSEFFIRRRIVLGHLHDKA